MKRLRFVVVGLGNFGSSVAEMLTAQGHEVLAIDLSEETVDQIAPLVTQAIVGDATRRDTLKQIGAAGADAAIVSTGDDITASILSTMFLHDLEVKNVYVKVISRDHARIMKRIGATESIFPERESALSLGTRLSGVGLLNYLRLGSGFSIQEMAVPAAWQGKSLRALHLRQKYNITVVALHDRLNEEITATPDPDIPLRATDALLVVGKDLDLAEVAHSD